MTPLHKVAKRLKVILPKPAFSFVRRVGTATLTPVLFSYRTGHFQSALSGKAIDDNSSPIPMYTYPATDHLRQFDYSDKSVLEFGSGQSTIWWGRRAHHVVAFEANRSWQEYVQLRVTPNVRVHYSPTNTPTLEILAGEQFDVIVVDGLNRPHCAEQAIPHLLPGGFFVVDNAAESGASDVLISHGFQRVDFYGHVPAVLLPQCTSIFFRESSFVLRPPQRPVSLDDGLTRAEPS